jgi:hypothetical protein
MAVKSTMVSVRMTPMSPGAALRIEVVAQLDLGRERRRRRPARRQCLGELGGDAQHGRVGAVDEELYGRACRIEAPALEVLGDEDTHANLPFEHEAFELGTRRDGVAHVEHL